MIKIINVTKKFGKKVALKNINLEGAEGVGMSIVVIFILNALLTFIIYR